MKKIMVLCMFVMQLSYATQSPLPMLETTANKLKTALHQQNNTTVPLSTLRTLVKNIVLPIMDIKFIAQAVVGRTGWAGATASEKKIFQGLFIHKVINLYSNALVAYRDQSIRFLPLRPGVASSRIVNVTSVIEGAGDKNTLVYTCVRSGNAWKVIDFSVNGIAFVQSYQAQFSDIVQAGGLASLNKKLPK